MRFAPRRDILSLEEIAQIARAFTTLGADKLRITGGEPLVRRDILWLIEKLGKLPLRELTLSTNGSRLAQYARSLCDNGVSRLNISLDTLQAQRFKRITRVGNIENVIMGIDAALQAGFKRLKINSVIMKNRNHDEVPALVQFAIDRGMDISFIEEMPLGVIDEHSRREAFYSSEELIKELGQHYELTPSTINTGGPSRYYRVAGSNSYVGTISPHSHNFCASCNRVRITAQGRLLLCLGQEHSADLKQVLRNHPHNPHQLQQAIIKAMELKPWGHEFKLDEQPVILRHMSVTGG